MVCYSEEQLASIAQHVGFTAPAAQQIAGVMYRESGGCTSAPCAGAQTPGGPITDGSYSQLSGLGLTPHCGLLQWAADLFAPIYQSPGCLGDPQCELTAAYQASCGGNLASSPWGPDVGGSYGGCQLGALPGGSGNLSALTGLNPAAGNIELLGDTQQGGSSTSGVPWPLPNCAIMPPGTAIPGLTCATGNQQLYGRQQTSACSIFNLSGCLAGLKAAGALLFAAGLLFVGLLLVARG